MGSVCVCARDIPPVGVPRLIDSIGDLRSGDGTFLAVPMQETECSICQEVFAVGHEVTEAGACHHIFHRACVIQWLAVQSSCPMCRGPVKAVPESPLGPLASTTAARD